MAAVRSPPSPSPIRATSSKPPRSSIVPVLLLLLLVNLSATLYSLPLNRVIERRLCRDYYSSQTRSGLFPPSAAVNRSGSASPNGDGPIDEELCKIDVVQQQLARLQGVLETAWIVGDFIVTIPLALLAEKYGHRIILWLNLAPRVFMLVWAVIVGHFERLLPINAILIGPFFSFLGGDCVFNSIIYALAASLTQDYALRASYFAYMSSTTYVVSLTGPSLAAASMSLLLWLPFWIGLFLLSIAAIIIQLLPANRSTTPAGDLTTQDEARHPLLADTHNDSANSYHQHSSSADHRQYRDSIVSAPLLQQVRTRFRTMQSHITGGPRQRNLSLLLLSMVITSFASADTKLLAQYISKRYSWKFSSAGYILSLKALINLLLLTIIIPSLIKYFSLRYSNRTLLNIHGAQLSLVLSVFGALFIATSVTVSFLVVALPIYALGSALPIFTYSLLKSSEVSSTTPNPMSSSSGSTSHSSRRVEEPEDDGHDTSLFSLVMLLKTLGSLLGYPVMTWLWMSGMKSGGAALGLPYFASAGCYVLAMFVLKGMTPGESARERGRFED